MAAPDPRDVDRRLFELQLDRVRLRTMRSVELGRPTPSVAAVESMDVELSMIESRLASARREGG